MSSLPKHRQNQLAAVKFLVIDDQHHMRKVVRAMLIGMGARHVTEASDGGEGLQAILSVQPDIVLLDWDMPHVDGLELLRTVRRPGKFPLPDLPIIALTGHAERWRVVEAARYGINEYLLKPVSAQTLHQRITAVLQNPRQMMKLERYYVPAPRGIVMLDAET